MSFWEAVMGGLSTLTYWQIYAAAFIYFALFLIPMGLARLLVSQDSNPWGRAGCLMMIMLPAAEVVALAVYVLITAPIMLGVAEQAAWLFPIQIVLTVPVAFLKLVLFLVVSMLVMSILPGINQLTSLHTLVIGGITLAFVLSVLDVASSGLIRGRVTYFPGFWFTAGLLILGFAVYLLGVYTAAAITMALGERGAAFGQILMTPIVAAFGFFPLFCYGAWLGAQIRFQT